MRYVAGRPVGLWMIIALIVADGLGFVVASAQLVASAPGEWLAILASSAIGGLLLFKAYRLWCFHRTAWLLVLVATTIGGAIHTLEITRGHREPGMWLAVAWALVTVVYLAHPSVRELFQHPRPDSTL